MLDGYLRRWLDAPLDAAGRMLARRGVTANQVTSLGLAVSLGAAAAIAAGHPWVGLGLVALGRLLDGLDGAVARATAKTDLGGYLDIVFDFVFYGAVPLGFALSDSANALPAAFLLFSFYVNGASFLGFATFAAKRGLTTQARGEKSLYFTAGLAEGTETIAVFVAACLWPAAFPLLAWGFGAVCLLTAAARIALAVRTFGS